MTRSVSTPRILFVAPEVAYLPEGMDKLSKYVSVKGGGMADVLATLIRTLYEQGADVHVALPDYCKIFKKKLPLVTQRYFNNTLKRLPQERVYLARDRSLFHADHISYEGGPSSLKIALSFQREVLNRTIPQVQPDLIHCHDWMTGLIPAMTRQTEIPCLLTLHNIHTEKCPLALVEDIGIDAASFWQNLFYERYPSSYEKARDTNPVDMLASGILSAHFIKTVSPTFMLEMIHGRHNGLNRWITREVAYKWDAGCAAAILNAPDPSFNPLTDKALFRRFSAGDHYANKQYNKLFLQEKLGLIMDSRAPVFFWPSRLDGFQKGCRLLAEILPDVIGRYRNQNIEVVFVADGVFQNHFKKIVDDHGLHKRVAVCDFEERLSRQAYGAADFVLMPSVFEPCGLAQMIGALYGALPVAHDTGGIHDTVIHLDVDKNSGNGFLFKNHDPDGLFWAINRAMSFYNLPMEKKTKQIERVMTKSAASFNPLIMTSQYIQLYEKMLERPLLPSL